MHFNICCQAKTAWIGFLPRSGSSCMFSSPYINHTIHIVQSMLITEQFLKQRSDTKKHWKSSSTSISTNSLTKYSFWLGVLRSGCLMSWGVCSILTAESSCVNLNACTETRISDVWILGRNLELAVRPSTKHLQQNGDQEVMEAIIPLLHSSFIHCRFMEFNTMHQSLLPIHWS